MAPYGCCNAAFRLSTFDVSTAKDFPIRANSSAMAIVHISPRAAEVVARVRRERSGPLTFTIDGGCCEGTAPHLFEHAVLTAESAKIGEAEGVPVYLQPAMVPVYAEAEITIDVIDDPTADAMSLETEYGLRFVLREARRD